MSAVLAKIAISLLRTTDMFLKKSPFTLLVQEKRRQEMEYPKILLSINACFLHFLVKSRLVKVDII